MQLIIGTKNLAKIHQLKGALEPLALDIQGLPDDNFPEVKEDGATALENARKKALAYSSVLGQPVLSMDNALYLEGLSAEDQPGLNVRHISGRLDRPTDAELLEYYTKLIASLGGRVDAYWEYGFCLAYPDGQIKETILKAPRLFVSQPSQKVIAGYPLESIQINPATGQYIAEMTLAEQDIFWQEMIGKDLSVFIKENLIID